MEAPDFFVEDLLDLSNGGDDMSMTDAFFYSVAGNSTDSSGVTPVDSCNSSVSGHDFPSRPSFPDHFSGDLCVPYDDLAELEWLSNFVEESLSSKDLPKFHLIPVSQQLNGPAQYQNPTRLPNPNPPTTVPGKARSKRSRVAPCDWSTRLLMVAPTSASTSPATSSSDPNPTQKKSSSKRRENSGSSDSDNPNGELRRCLHCAAEKTPQWRTGPMGPKTLCNACGVRYKSGRLVPEYRPAASPTFISTKHSNSHRKVVELRRQKELQRQQMVGHHHHHQQQSMMIGVSNGGDDYLIRHHMGPDYHQMI